MSRQLARTCPDHISAQSFAAELLELVKYFFEELAPECITFRTFSKTSENKKMMKRCNPDFAWIVSVAQKKMKKRILGGMNRAENLACLHSKVLRRGWQGSRYVICLQMRRSGSEKRNPEFLWNLRKEVPRPAFWGFVSAELIAGGPGRSWDHSGPLKSP